MRYNLSGHARKQMRERNISAQRVDAVLQNPDQIVAGHSGRNVYQSKFVSRRTGQEMLLRIVVIDTLDPAVVASVYPTDQVERYWMK